MREYHKIQSLYKRSEDGKRMLFGEFSLPEFEYLKDCRWVFTEKVDGTNIRVMWKDGAVEFGGKTDAAQVPATLVKVLYAMFLPDALSSVFPDGDACLYGEGYGAKIQSGGKYRPDQSFVLFDVKVGEWWLQRPDVEDVGRKLEVPVVPICGEGTLATLENVVRGGFTSHWGDFPAEGIVARPAVEIKTRRGDRIITKLKHRDFK